jgi:YesN/AraC family two-component response regulator
MIEFSVSDAVKRTVIIGDEPPATVEGRSFTCMMGDEPRRSYAEDGVNVEIVSVAVSFDDLSFSRKELGREDMADETVLLLPSSHEGMLPKTLARIENLLYRVMESRKEHSASAEMMCAATVLSLLFELDRTVRRALQGKKDQYIHYYVDKAESILLRNYSQRLSLQTIAKEMGITPNYLSSIFKASKGISFSDRLLEIRMGKASELLKEGRLSLSELSEAVGYEDIGHFRRRFKQYFGISVKDYGCINKELTLYHSKPQRRSE